MWQHMRDAGVPGLYRVKNLALACKNFMPELHGKAHQAKKQLQDRWLALPLKFFKCADSAQKGSGNGRISHASHTSEHYERISR